MVVRYMLLGLFFHMMVSSEPTMSELATRDFLCSKDAIEQYCTNYGTSALAKDVLKEDTEMLRTLPDDVKGQLHELFDKEGQSCAKRLWLTVAVSTSCFLYGMANILWAQSDSDASFIVVPEQSTMVATGIGAYALSILNYYSGCLPEYDSASRRLNRLLNKRNK